MLYTFLSPLQAHRKHAEYLNKKIDFYDELAIVVGKDTTTGGFSKSYVDLENEPDNGDNAEFVADNVEEGRLRKGKMLLSHPPLGREFRSPTKERVHLLLLMIVC